MPIFVPLGSASSFAVLAGNVNASALNKVFSAKPCLACLSEKELKGIISYALRKSTGLTLAQVNSGSAIYRTLAKKQMLVALATMITDQLVPGASVNELANAARCSVCESDKAIEAAILYLFYNYYQTTAI